MPSWIKLFREVLLCVNNIFFDSSTRVRPIVRYDCHDPVNKNQKGTTWIGHVKKYAYICRNPNTEPQSQPPEDIYRFQAGQHCKPTDSHLILWRLDHGMNVRLASLIHDSPFQLAPNCEYINNISMFHNSYHLLIKEILSVDCVCYIAKPKCLCGFARSYMYSLYQFPVDAEGVLLKWLDSNTLFILAQAKRNRWR